MDQDLEDELEASAAEHGQHPLPVIGADYWANTGKVEPIFALLEMKRQWMAEAWDEGLSAGSDRWEDCRVFGDKPVNPYRD